MGRTDLVAQRTPAQGASVWAVLVDADSLLGWLPPIGARGRFEHSAEDHLTGMGSSLVQLRGWLVGDGTACRDG